jgi:N-acetylglucosamine malate deacetylase 1
LNKLIIAPHADDEALGCASVLDDNTWVFIVTINRERENETLYEALEFEFSYSFGYHTQNGLDFSKVVNDVEEWMNFVKPEKIFIPHPGYHQDHQVTYDACLAALRPHDKNFFVKKVLVYEGIHDFLWSDRVFIPNYFIPLDVEKKVKAFSYYESQMKAHRDIESIKRIASLRGMQSGLPFAEAFQIKRWVEY